MQVFKLYFKILLRGLIFSLILYIILFGFLTMMFTNLDQSSSGQSFDVNKCRVAVIDNDNSKISAGLTDYMKSNSKFTEINDTSEEGLKDAIFFRYAEYIVIIPEGFGEKFFTDDSLLLQTMRIPNSASGMLLDTMTDKYLNTLRLYADMVSSDNIILSENIDTAIQKTKDNLTIETKVMMENGEKNMKMPDFLYYFNYYVYPIVAIMILCVSGIMIIINKMDVKRRNICAPISMSNFNIQLFSANILLSLGLFAIFLIYAVVLYSKTIFSVSGMLIVLNALIFTVVSLSLCFLISNIAVNGKSISAISNLLSLGGCFLGGVFVPQELLSETVKNVAVINPVFWYVKANNLLGNLSTFNYETMKPVIFSMIVEICFAAAFLSIALVIIKQKRTQEQ